MVRTWRRVAALAIVLASVGPGCTSGPDCSPAECGRLTIESRMADASSSAISIVGSPRPLVGGIEGRPVAEGTCFAAIAARSTDSLIVGSTVGVAHRLSARCLVAGETVVFAVALDDLRVEPAGSLAREVTGWTSRSESVDCWIRDPRGQPSAEVVVAGGPGAVAPFPAMVTSDFRREVTIRITNTACTPIDATLRFVMVPSDFKGRIESCEVCAL